VSVDTDRVGGDEEALLRRVARKDERAFRAIYDRYARSVYSLALGLLRDSTRAEEVTQEVFLAIWRGAAGFDADRGRARTWILSLAHHRTVDAIRRQRLRDTEPLDPALPAPSDAADDAIRGVESARVRDALARLSPVQREAIGLAYYGGYTQEEIARRVGVPLGTVKTRMRDGLLRLRDMLESARPGVEAP
jgi:RNA polymerase sigma-70 factor (ECF subfamily)